MVTPGSIYKHYKGGMYKIITVSAKCSETGQQLVVYQDLIDETKIWVRPYVMFFETVEVEDQVLDRFTYIST